MKRLRLAHWLVVCSACGPIAWFSPAPAAAAENQQAAQSAPAAELERTRQDFVKNFKRIGLNTTPGDAAFLRIMVEISGAKRGVEVGTATGYGAIHMGCGFERNGGHLTTIEIDPRMAEAGPPKYRRDEAGEVDQHRARRRPEGDPQAGRPV